MAISVYRSSGKFKRFLFILAILIIFVLLLYTQNLVNNLRAEARKILEFYAHFYVRAVSEADDAELNFIFEEIIKRTDFPIVLSDTLGNPTAWKGIDVDPTDYSEEAIQKVRKLIAAMKKEIDPIPLRSENIFLGYLYFGDSREIQQLQWLPYVEIVVVGLFIMVGFFGFNSIRRSEQQFIWVGMAKETAHQLGTPLSSLMGWIQLLRSKCQKPEQATVLDGVEQDIERLNKVTQRFSQIGSKAELQPHDLNQLVDSVLAYFNRRLPQMGKKVSLRCEGDAGGPVPINPELFEWVLENLIKNALDAIGTKDGTVTVRVGPASEKKYRAFIDVVDDGKGIETQARKNIFKPGFSTKTRGWGLGLSLARRIVEEYHGGKLLLKESQPGKGTTIRILI